MDHLISRGGGAGIFPCDKLFFLSLFPQQVIFFKSKLQQVINFLKKQHNKIRKKEMRATH